MKLSENSGNTPHIIHDVVDVIETSKVETCMTSVVPRYSWYCGTTVVPWPRRYWYREKKVPRFHGTVQHYSVLRPLQRMHDTLHNPGVCKVSLCSVHHTVQGQAHIVDCESKKNCTTMHPFITFTTFPYFVFFAEFNRFAGQLRHSGWIQTYNVRKILSPIYSLLLLAITNPPCSAVCLQ